MTEGYLIRANLFRKKLRTTLLILAIFIAFLIFSILVSFSNALNSGVDSALANRLITVNKINFTQPLPYAYYERVKALDDVKAVAHANWFGGYYQEPRNQIVVFATNPEEYLKVYTELVAPPEQVQAFIADKGGIMVGQRLADRFGWKVGDTIPLKSNIFPRTDGKEAWDFKISAIFTANDEKVDTTYAVFHYENFRAAAAFGGDNLGWFILNTTEPSKNEAVIDQIDTLFANSVAETETSTEAAFNAAFIKQIGDIGFIITSVTSAAFATILLIVGNSMVMAIRERTKEIAVMKTLGFPAPRIFRMVLSESVLLAMIGGLMGVGAGFLTIEGMKAALDNFLPGLALSPVTVGVAVAIMIALGLVTGALPAFNAMRVNVVNALQRS